MRFSLRSLLIFTAIVGGPAALIGQRIHANRFSTALASELSTRYPGGVHFKDQQKKSDQPPTLLNSIFKPRRAVRICLRADGLTDEEFENICRLRDLESISLSGASITSDAIPELRRLRELNFLNLSRTSVRDRDVFVISRLDSLETLHLVNTQISDACIPDLSKMKNLKTLGIKGTQISEQGVKQLQSTLKECRINR